jgi:hypothetical protein
MVKVFNNQPATLYPISDSTRRALAVAVEDEQIANELVDAIDTSRSVTGQIVLSDEDFRKGTIGPTDDTIGTTPTIHVLLFDAVNELLSGHIMFPLALDRTRPIEVHHQIMLSTAQTNGDTLDLAMDYVITQPEIPGQGFNKTSTHLTTSVTFTTENGLSAGDIYHLNFTIDPLDADNPLADSDAIGMEIHMDNVNDVAQFHWAMAFINYFDAHPLPADVINPSGEDHH